MITSQAHDTNAQVYRESLVMKKIVIEDNVWLGAGAIVLPGVRIGQNAVIGSGAVVTRDVPESDIVAGVPAKSIRK